MEEKSLSPEGAKLTQSTSTKKPVQLKNDPVESSRLANESKIPEEKSTEFKEGDKIKSKAQEDISESNADPVKDSLLRNASKVLEEKSTKLKEGDKIEPHSVEDTSQPDQEMNQEEEKIGKLKNEDLKKKSLDYKEDEKIKSKAKEDLSELNADLVKDSLVRNESRVLEEKSIGCKEGDKIASKSVGDISEPDEEKKPGFKEGEKIKSQAKKGISESNGDPVKDSLLRNDSKVVEEKLTEFKESDKIESKSVGDASERDKEMNQKSKILNEKISKLEKSEKIESKTVEDTSGLNEKSTIVVALSEGVSEKTGDLRPKEEFTNSQILKSERMNPALKPRVHVSKHVAAVELKRILESFEKAKILNILSNIKLNTTDRRKLNNLSPYWRKRLRNMLKDGMEYDVALKMVLRQRQEEGKKEKQQYLQKLSKSKQKELQKANQNKFSNQSNSNTTLGEKKSRFSNQIQPVFPSQVIHRPSFPSEAAFQTPFPIQGVFIPPVYKKPTNNQQVFPNSDPPLHQGYGGGYPITTNNFLNQINPPAISGFYNNFSQVSNPQNQYDAPQQPVFKQNTRFHHEPNKADQNKKMARSTGYAKKNINSDNYSSKASFKVSLGHADANSFLNSEELSNLQQAILNAVQEIPDNGPEVKFQGCTHKDGWLIIDCVDKTSVQWVEFISKIIYPWPDARIRFVNGIPPNLSPPHVVRVLIPDDTEYNRLNANDVLVRLRKMNRQLNTDKWRVLSQEIFGSGQHWTFGIDNMSLDVLKGMHLKAYFGFGQIEFSIRNPENPKNENKHIYKPEGNGKNSNSFANPWQSPKKSQGKFEKPKNFRKVPYDKSQNRFYNNYSMENSDNGSFESHPQIRHNKPPKPPKAPRISNSFRESFSRNVDVGGDPSEFDFQRHGKQGFMKPFMGYNRR